MIKSNTVQSAPALGREPGTSKTVLFRTLKELKSLLLFLHINQLSYWQRVPVGRKLPSRVFSSSSGKVSRRQDRQDQIPWRVPRSPLRNVALADSRPLAQEGSRYPRCARPGNNYLRDITLNTQRFKQSFKIMCFRNNQMCCSVLTWMRLATVWKPRSETEKPMGEVLVFLGFLVVCFFPRRRSLMRLARAWTLSTIF